MINQQNNQFYVLFKLNKFEYAVLIDQVNEVIPVIEVTPVPNEAPYILGVTNLRGKIIPIIDLELKMNLPALKTSEVDKSYRHFLIAGPISSPIGLRVNKVLDIITINKSDIKPLTLESQKVANLKFISGEIYLLSKERNEAIENIENVLEEIRKNTTKVDPTLKRVVYILNVDSIIYEEERRKPDTSMVSP